jgi:hypothetical protein
MTALLLRCLPLLVMLLTGGVTLARWGGELRPPEDARAAALARCDDRPCVLGLVPGASRWEDVRQLLEESDARTLYRRVEPPAELGFFPSVDKVSLGQVSINLQQPMQAGWVIQRFGAPCGVSIYWEMNIVTLRYPALLANISMIGNGLHLTDPVTSIHLSDPHFHMERQPDLCIDSLSPHAVHNTVWMGFAPYRRYLELRLGFSRF